MNRRQWLALAAACGAGAVCGGLPAWAQSAQVQDRPKRLVLIFLRGAVDGLHVLAPYTESAYRQSRPTLALASPGQEGGVLDLDGHFGLHPALADLMPLWQAGRLGFVHASGSPLPTRSHFDAQDFMETAEDTRKQVADGWLNRVLGQLPTPPQQAGAARALSVGATLPRIFAGNQPVATLAAGAAAMRPTVLDHARVADAFAAMYGGQDQLSLAYQASRAAHRELMASMDPKDLQAEMLASAQGAPLSAGFPQSAARLAQMLRKDARIQLAFMALGGWDTHANQGAAKGQLATRLAPLGQGLAALTVGLGDVLDDTMVVVMSEFGRTVKQNGNQGTDHGHGNVMWLLGGHMKGGRVLGSWPGLDESSLFEGRDLAVTTDFRSVLSQICAQHLGLNDHALAQVFPNWGPGEPGPLRFTKA